jgi:hypothetical protein
MFYSKPIVFAGQVMIVVGSVFKIQCGYIGPNFWIAAITEATLDDQ